MLPRLVQTFGGPGGEVQDLEGFSRPLAIAGSEKRLFRRQ